MIRRLEDWAGREGEKNVRVQFVKNLGSVLRKM